MDVFNLQAAIALDTRQYENALNESSRMWHTTWENLETPEFPAADTAEFEVSISDVINAAVSAAANIGSAFNAAADMISAIGSAVADAGKTIWGFANTVASAGDSIDKVSQKMGISAEAYQELSYIFERSGADVGNLQTSMRTLANVITDTADGSDSAAKKLERVGLSLDDLAGKTQEEQLYTVVEALQGMEAGAERTAAATDLLGRSASDMAAVLNMSAEETEALRQEAHDYGMIMSDDAVKASASFEDSLTRLNHTVDGVKNRMIGELLPGLTLLMDGIADFAAGNENASDTILNGIDNIADKLTSVFDTALTTVTDTLPQLFSTGAQIVENIAAAVVDNAPKLLESAADMVNMLVTGISDGAPGFMKAVTDTITLFVDTISDNAETILDGGLTIIESIAKGFTDNFSKMLSAVIDLFDKLGVWIGEHLPEVVVMGLEMLTSLVNGILDNLPKLAEAAADIVASLVDYALEHLPEILDLALDMIMTLVDGLTGDNLKKIGEAAIDLVTRLVDTLSEHLPEIFDKGAEILGKLIAGIITDAPQLIGNALTVITDLICELAFNHDWTEIGKDIINGISRGITQGTQAIKDGISEAGNAVYNGFCDFFGIASPSKLMRDKIGKFIPLGIAEGIEEEENAVTKAIRALTSRAAEPVSIATDVEIPKLDDISNVLKLTGVLKASTATMTNVESLTKLPKIDTLSHLSQAVGKATELLPEKEPIKEHAAERQIVINNNVSVNGIQYQNISELTTAISEELEMQTRRALAGYGLCV